MKHYTTSGYVLIRCHCLLTENHPAGQGVFDIDELTDDEVMELVNANV